MVGLHIRINKDIKKAINDLADMERKSVVHLLEDSIIAYAKQNPFYDFITKKLEQSI